MRVARARVEVNLRNNTQKASVFPIQCRESEVETLQEMIPCEISGFPCKYLGVPLFLNKTGVWPQVARAANRQRRRIHSDWVRIVLRG
jgi:hypothetical protein